jgi:hypothetical protein
MWGPSRQANISTNDTMMLKITDFWDVTLGRPAFPNNTEGFKNTFVPAKHPQQNRFGNLRSRTRTLHVGRMTRCGPDLYKPWHVPKPRVCEWADGFSHIMASVTLNETVTLCSLVDGCQRSVETYCLHLRLPDYRASHPGWPLWKQQLAYATS